MTNHILIIISNTIKSLATRLSQSIRLPSFWKDRYWKITIGETAKNIALLYIVIALMCGLLGVVLSAEIRDQYAKDIGLEYSTIAVLCNSYWASLLFLFYPLPGDNLLLEDNYQRNHWSFDLSNAIGNQLGNTVLEIISNYISEIRIKYCNIVDSFITGLFNIIGFNDIGKIGVYYDGPYRYYKPLFSRFLEAVVDSHAQANSLLNLSIFNITLGVLLLVYCYRIKTVGPLNYKIIYRDAHTKVIFYVVLILIGAGSLIMQYWLYALWSKPLPDNLDYIMTVIPKWTGMDLATYLALVKLSNVNIRYNLTILVCYWSVWAIIGLVTRAVYKITSPWKGISVLDQSSVSTPLWKREEGLSPFYPLEGDKMLLPQGEDNGQKNRAIGSRLWKIIIMYLMVYLYFMVMFYYVHNLPMVENATTVADIIAREPKYNFWKEFLWEVGPVWLNVFSTFLMPPMPLTHWWWINMGTPPPFM